MSSHTWQVTLKISHKAVDGAVSMFESMGFEPISWFECVDGPMSNLKDDNDLPIAEDFLIQGFCKNQPNYSNIQTQVHILGELYRVLPPELTIESVDTSNKSYIQKPEIKKIGRFVIHPVGEGGKVRKTNSEIPLLLNAAMTFGSGDHPTTEMCLKALSQFKFPKPPKHVLDMGCGSGVLAMASAKLWPSAEIDAVDIDPVSVRTTITNTRQNGVHHISAMQGSHLQLPALRNYDLILANILCKPLCKMAKDFSNRTKLGGYIIISGFLDMQKRTLISTFTSHNFVLKKDLKQGQWHALILEKHN